MDKIKIDGVVGSDEWWSNIRKTRGDIEFEIDNMDLRGGSVEDKRKWTDMLVRLDKMIGDASGVFVKDDKSVALRDKVTFVVVMPGGGVQEKVVEKARYEVMDESEGD
jgi:hypothetical protein